MTLKEAIETLIREAGSAYRLAKKTGVDKATISRIRLEQRLGIAPRTMKKLGIEYELTDKTVKAEYAPSEEGPSEDR